MYYVKSKKSAKGAAMIEGLIGAALVAILFVGLMAVFARVLVSQRYMNVHNIAVTQIRESIEDVGLENVCSDSVTEIDVDTFQVSMTSAVCSSSELTNVGVQGLLIDLPSGTVPVTSMSWSTAANTANEDLIGGDGVITVSF